MHAPHILKPAVRSLRVFGIGLRTDPGGAQQFHEGGLLQCYFLT